MTKRYCGPCDKWVPAKDTVCKACGADTDRLTNEDRERGDDDGLEYGDPRDERDERFDELMAFVLGPRPDDDA